VAGVFLVLGPLLLPVPVEARSGKKEATVPANIYIPIEDSILKKDVLSGHRGAVQTSAFSHDGSILATGGQDKTVILWDAVTGEQISSLKGHRSTVYAVAFSPDGKLLASASHDRTIHIWDVETGKMLQTLKGHSSVVYALAFSPDGKLIASGGHDRTVRIWSVKEGKRLHTLKDHRSVVTSVAFSPDGKTLATGGLDRLIILWNTTSWEKEKVLKGHKAGIEVLVFSPDGKLLVSAGEDRVIYLWDFRKGENAGVLKGHTSTINALAFGPGSDMLLSGGRDQSLLQWSLDDRRLVRKYEGQKSIIYSVSMGPQGKRVVTTGQDGGVVRWEMTEFSSFRKRPSESEAQFSARVGKTKVPFVAPVSLGRYDKRKSGYEATISGASVFIPVPRDKIRMVKKQKGNLTVQGNLVYVDKEKAELVDALLAGGVTGEMLAFGMQTGDAPEVKIQAEEPEKKGPEQKKRLRESPAESIELGAPDLSYTVDFTDSNSDAVIQGGETVSLRISVRNQGKGSAKKVRVTVSGEDSVLNAIGRGKVIGDIAPGEEKAVEFSGMIPYEVEEKNVTMEVKVTEAKGYSPRKIKAFTIAMKPAEMERTTTVLSNIDDVNVIPSKPKGYSCKDCYAVVIGISKYRSVPEVKYASKDAETIRKYLETVGGIPSQNIKFLSDDTATKADIESSIEEWLPKRVKSTSKVFVYYSGHGTPDPRTNESFLVPYEGEPGSVKKLYPLKKMYSSLSSLPAKQMVVMLDSCFSGSGERSIFPEGARPVSLSVENPILAGNKMIVLAASKGDEISSDYDAAGHGLFTYYLLKGMKGDADTNGDGKVDIAELYMFVKDRVSETALNTLDREQNPVLLPGYEQVKSRHVSFVRTK